MTADKQKCCDADPIPGSFEIPSKILNEEVEVIRKRRQELCPESSVQTPEVKKNLVGLALSGGGIRSAIFSLGVIQCLAQYNYLKRVDYLSTVSGGGFIGGSLTWLMNRAVSVIRKKKGHKPYDTTNQGLPYGVEDSLSQARMKGSESNILKHMRMNGKYLVPGKGITWASLIVVILRGILLGVVPDMF